MENESRQVVKKIMPLSINLFLGSYVSSDLLALLLRLDLIPPYRITADMPSSIIQVHFEKKA